MNKNTSDFIYEDISSSSKGYKYKSKLKQIPKSLDKYGDGALTKIDKVIKIISFVVAISIALVFALIAIALLLIDKVFLLLAIGVLIIGIALALIALFLIYGLGHIITQNNEILKRL